jgi:hypothetical protein
VLFLIACNQPKNTDNPLLDTDTLAVFLTELHFLESMVNNKYIKSENAAFYYNQLFKEHNVTAAQFDEALEWYENNYDAYIEMYGKVRKNFDDEMLRIKSGIYEGYDPKTASVWKYYGVFPATDTLWHTYQEYSYYLQLPASELRTKDCRRYPYIERLGSNPSNWKIWNQ